LLVFVGSVLMFQPPGGATHVIVVHQMTPHVALCKTLILQNLSLCYVHSINNDFTFCALTSSLTNLHLWGTNSNYR